MRGVHCVYGSCQWLPKRQAEPGGRSGKLEGNQISFWNPVSFQHLLLPARLQVVKKSKWVAGKWGFIAWAGARLEIWLPAPSCGRFFFFFWYPLIQDFTALYETNNYLTCFLPWGQDFLHAPPSCGCVKQPICTMVKLDSFLMHDLVGSASSIMFWDTAWSFVCTISTPVNVEPSVCFHSSSMPVAAQVSLFWTHSSFK